MKNNKAQLILNEVEKRTSGLSKDDFLNSEDFDQSYHTTISIANDLNMQRTNVSKCLNDLVENEILIKVTGKPILFFHKRKLEEIFDKNFNEYVYDKESILNALNDNINITEEKNENEKVYDVFKNIVGFNDTLKNQVSLAKAAVTYPPLGLNTMLIGSTGCGKSTFAEAMYNYGMAIGMFYEDTKFVVFNCADYSDNPQLLVSQLFGNIKGAYTGADTERTGLVDKANGGILFLDEVHRLPKEGQEMLFTLMDKGIYRRVGETDTTRKANLMIIAATTERKNSQLLNTFIRRIPITIELPDISKYNMQERLELIFKFFYVESAKTKRKIKVSKKILKSCLNYDCPLNIGGLKSDIQLICAKGYFSCVTNSQSDIKIKWNDIPNNMKLGLINTDHESNNYADIVLDDTIIFDYSEVNESKYLLNQMNKFEHENKYYSKIIEDYYELSLKNEENDNVRKKVEDDLKSYFLSMQEKIRSNQLPEYGELLARIVDERIIEAVIDAIDSVKTIYNNQENNKRIVCALSLHINNLIERIKSGKYSVNNNLMKSVEQLYPIDYYAAQKIIEILSKELDIEISSNEIMFVTMLLHTMNDMDMGNKIGVLCIAHGSNVASSIAEVVNTLLDIEGLYALDVPLNEKVESILNKAIDLVREMDKGKGVILLTDMGSLCDFDTLITEETGIPTIAIPNVTTLMALEITRRAYSSNVELDAFYNELIDDDVIYNKTNINKNNDTLMNSEEKKFIKVLDEMLTFINPTKIYNSLKSVLLNIWNDLGLSEDKMFEYKFIMHCAFMVERAIKKEPMPGKNLNYYYNNRKETLNKLEEYFKPVYQEFGFIMYPSEYEAIIEMFDVHYNLKI